MDYNFPDPSIGQKLCQKVGEIYRSKNVRDLVGAGIFAGVAFFGGNAFVSRMTEKYADKSPQEIRAEGERVGSSSVETVIESD